MAIDEEEIPAMIFIHLLAIVEHIKIAPAFAGSSQADAVQEVLTQSGDSKCIACFFQAYPTTGCFSHTAVNGFRGVETPKGEFWLEALKN